MMYGTPSQTSSRVRFPSARRSASSRSVKPSSKTIAGIVCSCVTPAHTGGPTSIDRILSLLPLLLQPAQELDQVADLPLRELRPQVVRHGRPGRPPVVDVRRLHRHRLAL